MSPVWFLLLFHFRVVNPSRCFMCLYTSFFYFLLFVVYFSPSLFLIFRCVLHPFPLPLSSCLGCIPPLIGLPSLRNDNSEAPIWVRRGPCTTRRLKAFKASHVWAAGGARAQARGSTGDVVGGLPPEKYRGLRGGPAQRQRTEVGRIRSCCQGWTGLDDCCEEHGQVAPGGREGRGST